MLRARKTQQLTTRNPHFFKQTNQMVPLITYRKNKRMFSWKSNFLQIIKNGLIVRGNEKITKVWEMQLNGITKKIKYLRTGISTLI